MRKTSQKFITTSRTFGVAYPKVNVQLPVGAKNLRVKAHGIGIKIFADVDPNAKETENYVLRITEKGEKVSANIGYTLLGEVKMCFCEIYQVYYYKGCLA